MGQFKILLLAICLHAFAGSPESLKAQSAEAGPPLRLPDLVREALERNPEIQAARRALEAKRARVPLARAWPDPTITLTYGGNVVPPFTLMRGDPSSARQFAAAQEIPYPGKTRLRGEIAAREADAEALEVEGIARRIAAEMKQAYFDLYFTDQALATLREDHALLEKIARIAEIRYSVGKGEQQDVLKAQVELSRLRQRQTLLDQTRRTLEAQLNSLRDLPVDAPVGPTVEVRASALTASLEELEAAAVASFPALRRQRTQVEGSRLGVDLARREIRPNFNVGYFYMQRADLPDMYGITFSTSLPIFRRRKQDRAVAEAAANLEASRWQEANELRILRFRLRQEYLAAQAAEQLMTLYAQAMAPQSRLALESSLAGYEVGKTEILGVLTNFLTMLETDLAYHEQLANREKSLARLEELTGMELIR